MVDCPEEAVVHLVLVVGVLAVVVGLAVVHLVHLVLAVEAVVGLAEAAVHLGHQVLAVVHLGLVDPLHRAEEKEVALLHH